MPPLPSDALLVLDVRGTVQHATPSAAQLLDLSLDALHAPDAAVWAARLVPRSAGHPLQAVPTTLRAWVHALLDAPPDDAVATLHLDRAPLVVRARALGSPEAPSGLLLTLTGGGDAAAQLHATARMQASEARFRLVVEHAQPVVFMTDSAGRFVLSAGRDLRALGLTPGQVVGQSAFALYADHPPVLAALDAALDGQRIQQIVRLGAAVFDCWFAPMRDEAGDTIGVLGMASDVTQRERAEAALQEQERRYRTLAESMRDVVLVQDFERRVTWVSPSVREMLGHDPEALVGRDLRALVHPDDRARLSARRRMARREALSDGREGASAQKALSAIAPAPLATMRLLRTDGSPVWVEALSYVVRDAHGDPMHVQSVIRDVSERVEAQRRRSHAVRRAEALGDLARSLLGAARQTPFADLARLALDRLRTLVPHLYSSAVLCHPDGTHAEVVATRAPDDTHLTPGQRLPTSYFRHLRELPPSGVYAEPDLAAVQPRSEREQALLGLGVRAHLNAPLAIDGAVVGTLKVGAATPGAYTAEHRVVVREVADMLALALRQARYEASLVEAKERAEAADRLKTAFLANMNHEVRTPLTSVIGFADLLAEELEAPHDDFAETIAQSGKRLMQTLDAVILFARLEGETFEMHSTPLDLASAVRTAVESFRPAARLGRVTLRTDLPPTPVRAVVDHEAVRRMLHLLVDNAIKFTTAGGTVTLRAARVRGAVRLSVADTGVGMSEDLLARVFEPFQQASTGLDRTHEGSGLGLPIVRRLVTLLGGRLAVQSTPERGTTCTVLLPLDPNAPLDDDALHDVDGLSVNDALADGASTPDDDRHNDDEPAATKGSGSAGRGCRRPHAREQPPG